MYVQVSVYNKPFSFQFETLEIKGHISDHTVSHVATTRNKQHRVFNEDGLLHSTEANFNKSPTDMLIYMSVSQNIYITWDIVVTQTRIFMYLSHMCMTNTHMHTHTPIYICMLPDLNINLIHHKNKDVTNYEAGDVKMYSIYQLTKDIHLSKDWCKSQGSSGVIHIEQSSTVEVSLQVSTCSILICNQGLVQKVHL